MGLRKVNKKEAERERTNNRERTLLLIVHSDNTFEKDERGWVGKCIHCNAKIRVTRNWNTLGTIEHIVPVCAGGSTDDVRNLALACAECNHEKGRRHDPNYLNDPRAFEVIGRLLKRRARRMKDEKNDEDSEGR
jgi:5-methylcytosine-specific restriction endonuclease McrA